jgi:hypothetical protein
VIKQDRDRQIGLHHPSIATGASDAQKSRSSGARPYRDSNDPPSKALSDDDAVLWQLSNAKSGLRARESDVQPLASRRSRILP